MAAPDHPTMLATGFVVDQPDQGTLFPSAGGNSADPRVQAVYWRCMIVFFASARITNPGLRLALFCNAAPPHVDGINIAAVLARYGVELRRVPLTARLGQTRTASWGNVLYFRDVMADLQGEAADLRIALTDCDMVVTTPLAPLFRLLDGHQFAGYVVDDTLPGEAVNGMTRAAMAAAARQLGADAPDLIDHFGGELLLTTPAAWARHRALFEGLLDDAQTGTGPGAAVRTEEHVYSIAFAASGCRVAQANAVMKRIWTSPRYNTARAGDENLPLWHLPAEKRYGLRDMFTHLSARGFPLDMDPAELRRLAMRLCGVPAKSPAKLLRDGVRQVAARLGLSR
ncbi:MAG: hypothetical protein ABI673_03210 [Novosphingobium sp.]